MLPLTSDAQRLSNDSLRGASVIFASTQLAGSTKGGDAASIPAQKAPSPEPCCATCIAALAQPMDRAGATTPDHFRDVATHEVMQDPVFCSDGFTYGRATAKRLKTSPYTREPLTILGPNVALRSAISAFKSQRDAAPPDLVQQTRAALPSVTRRYHFTGARDSEGRNHGWGSCSISLGSKVSAEYQGMFVHGVRHGHGVYMFASGKRYEGESVQGVPCGRGIHTWPDGTLYDGMHQDGLPHGRGKFVWSGIRRYEGMVQRGKPHGLGIYLEPYGERYEGMFEDGLKQGAGKQTYRDGRLYDGQWRDNKRWGQGTLTSQRGYPAYGERYIGNFEADHMHGQGVYSWPTGARFSGLFHQGRRAVDEETWRRTYHRPTSMLLK